MKVPVYDQQVQQAGFRGNQSQKQPDFLDTTQQVAIGATLHGLSGIQNAVEQQLVYNREQEAHKLRLYNQERDEVDRYRAQEAINQYKGYLQDAQFNPNTGWLNTKGDQVFKTQDGRPLSISVMENANKKRSEIMDALGTNQQKILFGQNAAELDLRQSALLQQHEAEQIQVYKLGVLDASRQSDIDNISLNYNDPSLIKSSLAKVSQYNSEYARLTGKPRELIEAQTKSHISEGLKGAMNAALGHNDYASAQKLYDEFGPMLDTHDREDMGDNLSTSYFQEQLQINPQAMVDALKGTRARAYNAIIMQESGGKDYGPDGKPLNSDPNDGFFRGQVTEKTARNPGFGIVPARAKTAEEYDRVGQELFSALADKYNDDYDKVAAAYNAGSGAVDAAIEKAGLNWKDALPESTRTTYLPAVKKNLATGTPLDNMTPIKRASALRSALGEVEKNRSIFKADLEKTIADQVGSVQYTGASVTRANPDQFQKAYGPAWQGEYQQYIDKLNYANNYHAISTAPTDMALQMIDDAKVKPGSTDPVLDHKNYESLKSAYEAVSKDRARDPVAWVKSVGGQVKEIADFSNANAVISELRGRTPLMNEVSVQYKTPFTVFSDSEQKQLTKVLDEGTEKEKLDTLIAIRDGIANPDAYSKSMASIKTNRPAMQLAAELVGKSAKFSSWSPFSKDVAIDGESVAKTIIKGEELLKSDKGPGFTVPADVDKAIYGQLGTALINSPNAEKLVVSAARAMYAARVDRGAPGLKDGNNAQLLDGIVKELLGVDEIANHSDTNVIQPYGMAADKFIETAKQKFDQYQTGLDFEDYPMIMAGENKYLLQSGSGALIVNGRPVILDFNR